MRASSTGIAHATDLMFRLFFGRGAR